MPILERYRIIKELETFRVVRFASVLKILFDFNRALRLFPYEIGGYAERGARP